MVALPRNLLSTALFITYVGHVLDVSAFFQGKSMAALCSKGLSVEEGSDGPSQQLLRSALLALQDDGRPVMVREIYYRLYLLQSP